MIDYTRDNPAMAKAKSYDMGLREYMMSIYRYLAVALAITGTSSFIALNFAPITRLLYQYQGHQITGFTMLGMIVTFAPLFIGFAFFSSAHLMSVNKARNMFLIYATLLGMSLSSFGLVYTVESITRTFLVCASAFAAVSLYGYTTDRDLTSMGSLVSTGLIAILVASLVNILLRSPALTFAVSILGIVIFIGFIAWDTQRFKNIYYASNPADASKVAIIGAFVLYLDFINLFVHLLHFMGKRRD
jgi:FtsH-binding integral membrane protein